jgi:hypothetical protein
MKPGMHHHHQVSGGVLGRSKSREMLGTDTSITINNTMTG